MDTAKYVTDNLTAEIAAYETIADRILRILPPVRGPTPQASWRGRGGDQCGRGKTDTTVAADKSVQPGASAFTHAGELIVVDVLRQRPPADVGVQPLVKRVEACLTVVMFDGDIWE
jgi:hypothetical protein